MPTVEANPYPWPYDGKLKPENIEDDGAGSGTATT